MNTQSNTALTTRISAKQLKTMTAKEFKNFAEAVIDVKATVRTSGFALRFPYALNCRQADKADDCSSKFTYTVFLNNSGRLCDVVYGEDPDVMITLRFSYSIKHLSKRRQKIAIWHRLHNIINVGECPK